MGSSTQRPVSRFAFSRWHIAVGGRAIGEGEVRSATKVPSKALKLSVASVLRLPANPSPRCVEAPA